VEEDIELALVTWINQLIGQARALGLVFSKFKIKRNHNQWLGEAAGEKWNENMTRGTEVKGATLTMLKVQKINHQWDVRCVVDV
jgi:SHS2 domain-containing protein